VICLVTDGQLAWTWSSPGTWLPLFPGAGIGKSSVCDEHRITTRPNPCVCTPSQAYVSRAGPV